MRSLLAGLLIVSLAACTSTTNVRDAGAPGSCTPEVNRQIGDLIERGEGSAVDNVAVCGTTFTASRPQRAGRNGGHQLIPLQIRLPDGHSALVEVVTNDDLDGRVTAPRGADVFALGQYYRTTARQRPYVAGVHDVHCATHRGAANGFVIVNGRRAPAHC